MKIKLPKILSKDLKSFPSFSSENDIPSIGNHYSERYAGMTRKQEFRNCSYCGVLYVFPTAHTLHFTCQYCNYYAKASTSSKV